MANKPVAIAFQTKFHFFGIKVGKFPSIQNGVILDNRCRCDDVLGSVRKVVLLPSGLSLCHAL